MIQFQNHMKDIKKREKIWEEKTRFYCPEPLCMWRKKEEKEEEKRDQDQYEWPCRKCEIKMTGDINTPYTPYFPRFVYKIV